MLLKVSPSNVVVMGSDDKAHTMAASATKRGEHVVEEWAAAILGAKRHHRFASSRSRSSLRCRQRRGIFGLAHPAALAAGEHDGNHDERESARALRHRERQVAVLMTRSTDTTT